METTLALINEEQSSTSPQDALQLLIALPSVDDLDTEDGAPLRIFLAFLRYIVARRPDGSIVGIWEELLCHTVKYSKDLFYLVDIYDEDGRVIRRWLDKVLYSTTLCSDPYMRLELFRLGRLFSLRSEFSWMTVCNTFMHTIGEINPHHFYHSGNVDDLLFGAIDMHYIFITCKNVKNFRELLNRNVQYAVSRYLIEGRSMFLDAVETNFLLKVIHLFGIFAAKAISTSDHQTRAKELEYCSSAFVNGVCPTVSNLSEIISHEPFLQHILQFMKNVAIVASTLKQASMCYNSITRLRTSYLRPSAIRSKPNDLPKLLMDRQMYGSRFVQQKYLINSRVKNPLFSKENDENSIIEKLLKLDANSDLTQGFHSNSSYGSESDDQGDYSDDYITTDDDM